MSAISSSSANSGNISKADAAWLKNAERVMLDLNSSTEDIMKVANATEGKYGNTTALGDLVAKRANLATMVSNIIRALADTMQNIIRNIR
ncbi:MAG: hypothetical protein IT291_06590 [Deltaproteobacteria bacterium]|nr:hypothetical protein [Deltaproteobacteria bacterium]